MKRTLSFVYVFVFFTFVFFTASIIAGGGPPPCPPAIPGVLPSPCDRPVGLHIGENPNLGEVTILQGRATSIQTQIFYQRHDSPEVYLVPGIPQGMTLVSKNPSVISVRELSPTGKFEVVAKSPGATTLMFLEKDGRIARSSMTTFTVTEPSELQMLQDSVAVISTREHYDLGSSLVIDLTFRRDRFVQNARLHLDMTIPGEADPKQVDLPIGPLGFNEQTRFSRYGGEIRTDAKEGIYRFTASLLDGDLVIARSRFSTVVGMYPRPGRIGEPFLGDTVLYQSNSKPYILSIYGGWLPARTKGTVEVYMDGNLISKERLRDFLVQAQNWIVSVDVQGIKFPVKRHNFLVFFEDTGVSVTLERVFANTVDHDQFDGDPFSNNQGKVQQGEEDKLEQMILDDLEVYLKKLGR